MTRIEFEIVDPADIVTKNFSLVCCSVGIVSVEFCMIRFLNIILGSLFGVSTLIWTVELMTETKQTKTYDPQNGTEQTSAILAHNFGSVSMK